jgi:L-amino acid N-acyltransferase YncA
VPPDLDEIARRWSAVCERGLPYLVASTADGVVAGYAYAAPYRPRPAYGRTVENSVYLAPEAAGRGIGRRLLDHLLDRCASAGIRQVVAVIGDSGNRPSIALHAGAGFLMIGTLRSVGFKHGRWLDTVIMQRTLGEGDATPPG